MLFAELAADTMAQAGPYEPHTIQTIVQHDISQWFMVGLGVLGFLITIIVTTGTIVWQAGNVRDDLVRGLAEHKAQVDREVDEMQRRFGEVAAALRDKITQVELFMRDEFIRKETFNLVIDRITAEWKAAITEIASRQLRMEGKLDEFNRNVVAGSAQAAAAASAAAQAAASALRPKNDQNEPS